MWQVATAILNKTDVLWMYILAFVIAFVVQFLPPFFGLRSRVRDFRGLRNKLIWAHIAFFLIPVSFIILFVRYWCGAEIQGAQNLWEYLPGYACCPVFKVALLFIGVLALIISYLPPWMFKFAYLSGSRIFPALLSGSLATLVITILVFFWRGRLDPLLSILLFFGPGFMILKLIEVGIKQSDLWKEERLAQTADAVRKLNKHTIVFGYGELGKLTLRSLVAVLSENETGCVRRLDEEGEYYLCNGLLIVDKDPAAFPILVGTAIGLPPLAVEEWRRREDSVMGRKFWLYEFAVGYEEKEPTKRFLIPALIGDEKSEVTLRNARVAYAEAIISTTRDIEADNALVDSVRPEAQAEGRKKLIIVCSRRSAADVLDKKCRLRGLTKYEVFEFVTYVAEILTDFASMKAASTDTDEDTKILVLGSFSRDLMLYHFLSSWAVAANLLKTQNGRQIIRNVLILDADADYSSTHSEDVSEHVLRWNAAVPGGIEIDSPNKEWYVAEFHNVGRAAKDRRLLYTPVLREPPTRYLKEVMSAWEPHLILILERRRGEALMQLREIERLQKQHNGWSLPKLIVVTDSPSLKHEVLGQMFGERGDLYAVFNPYASIAAEVAMMVKYL